MSVIASIQNLFEYATTDIHVTGILGWVGLLTTAAGFAVSIWQIRKVKTASLAANEAVARLVKVVRAQELSGKITNALHHLTSAQTLMKQDNMDAVVAHLFAGWNLLISARELTEGGADRDAIGDFLISTRRPMTSTHRALIPNQLSRS